MENTGSEKMKRELFVKIVAGVLAALMVLGVVPMLFVR